MKYSQEEIQFMKGYLPDHTHAETVEEHNRLFPGNQITLLQSRSFSKNYKVHSCNDGRYKKGVPSLYKGKKRPMKRNSGMFQKGNIPPNICAVGTKVKDVDGFWHIKVAEPNKWKLLQRYVWEQHNGPIKEKGHRIIFLDNNKDNCSIENLALITDRESMIMNRNGWRTEFPEITQAYVNILKLNERISKHEQNQQRGRG